MFLPRSSFSSFYFTLTSANFFSFREMVIKSVGFSPSLFSLYYLHFTFRIIFPFIFLLSISTQFSHPCSFSLLFSFFLSSKFSLFRRLLIFNNLHLRFPPCSCFFNFFSFISLSLYYPPYFPLLSLSYFYLFIILLTRHTLFLSSIFHI
jgi:hypothetical protein